jgi:hypothetical protein
MLMPQKVPLLPPGGFLKFYWMSMNLTKEKVNFFRPLDRGGFAIKLDDDSGSVVGIFEGKISVDDILAFWDELMKSDFLPSEMKGVILDFSKAILDFKASLYTRIVDYFVEHISFVRRFKIGVVANSPHNIVVVMLIARENFMYELRPFTTFNASLVWVKS